jgi:CubicO group peptidase (beta-lactamase class C family)
MKITAAASAVAVAIILCAPALHAQEPPPAAAPRPTAASVAADPAVQEALVKLDVWLEGRRYQLGLPGFSVGIVHDQQLLWSKGYGWADVAQRIPSTDRTLYRIASITKTFTATAVVQLAEQGRLSLEDPVVRHLAWFEPQGAAAGRPARVWQLLSHSAGLQREAPGSDWDALESPSAAEVAAVTRSTPLALEPDSRFAYSNYGYLVAGQLVQKVAGMPHAEYVRRNVLQPLGMTGTDFLDGTATRPGLAVPYGRRTPDGPRAIETQMGRSDAFDSVGAMVSSVSDLAKWVSFQFRDSNDSRGPVLSGPALRDMHRPHALRPDWGQGWGLGWRLTRRDTGPLVDHGGSLPGYRSIVLLDPASRVGVILLMNADDGPREMAAGMLKLVSGPIAKAASGGATAAPAADLSRYQGLYRDRGGESAYVAVADGRLQLLDPESDDIEAGALPLRQTGTHRFVTEAPPSAGTSGIASVVEFQVDASGRATSFTVENGAYRYRRAE